MKYLCFFHIFYSMNNDCFEYCGGKAITLFLILTLLQKYALQKFKIHIFLISSTFSKELAFFSELWYPFLRTYPFLRIYGIGWSQVRICGNYACFKVCFFSKNFTPCLEGTWTTLKVLRIKILIYILLYRWKCKYKQGRGKTKSKKLTLQTYHALNPYFNFCSLVLFVSCFPFPQLILR